MSVITQLKKFLKDETQTFRQIILALVVLAVDSLIKSEHLFLCPVQGKGNKSYGWYFTLIPALIFFFLALLMSGDFRKLLQGLCYENDPVARRNKKWFTCKCTGWSCLKTTKIFTLAFNGMIASCLWLSWAFLQAKYYTCAKLGNEQVRLDEVRKNETETKRIKDMFKNVKAESQVIGLLLLTFIVIIPTLILTVYRCFCKNSVSAIPRPEEYDKIEEEAAAEAYKLKFEEIAKKEGKRRAERSFTQSMDEDTTEVLEDVYKKLKNVDEFRGKEFSTVYAKAAAQAEKEAFEAKLKEAAKAKITTMVEKGQAKEGIDYEAVENAYNIMVDRYPRSSGDRSKPYVKLVQNADAELEEL